MQQLEDDCRRQHLHLAGKRCWQLMHYCICAGPQGGAKNRSGREFFSSLAGEFDAAVHHNNYFRLLHPVDQPVDQLAAWVPE